MCSSKRWSINGKEFDTYKVGTVANSCSTMHKIADKEFTLEDFSHEYLIDGVFDHYMRNRRDPLGRLKETIDELNFWRTCYNGTNKEVGNAEIINAKTGEPFTKKDFWWQMIQLLPSSYNQKRTVMLNYEVLTNMYAARKSHKLDEWRGFCSWVKRLPLSELIVRKEEEKPDLSKIPIANEIMNEAKRRVYRGYAFTEEEFEKIRNTKYPDRRVTSDNEFFTGLHRYEINYGYGIAILDTPYDPKERFYTLARTCFGIRKSISACMIISDTELPVTGFERLEFNGDCYIWRKDGARRMLSPNADDEWDTSFCERCRYVEKKGE